MKCLSKLSLNIITGSGGYKVIQVGGYKVIQVGGYKVRQVDGYKASLIRSSGPFFSAANGLL